LYTISDNIIIRQEKFGGLIFNPNSELTIKIDKSGFKFLKDLVYNDGRISEPKNYNISKNEMNDFFLKMIQLGIIIKKQNYINTKYQIIENVIMSSSTISFPETLHLSITYNCNLECVPCYYADILEKKNMTLEIYKKIIIEAKKEGLFQLAIGGGEPFCHPQIWDFLKLSSSKHITTNITTNGTLLGKSEIDKLENLGNIGRIQLSLDGAHEEVNSLSRSHYKNVILCLKNLSMSNLKFGINMLIRNSNIDDLPNMVKLCRDLGVRNLHLLRIKPPILNKKWFLRERLNEESINKLNHFLHIFKKQKNVEIFIDASMSYLFQNGDLIQLKYTGCNGCSGGITFLTILPDGNILPCTHLRKNLGHVNEGIKNIWINSEELYKLRKKEQWLDEPCKSCYKLKNCYGCRALSIEEQGSLTAYDRECLLFRNSN